MKKFLLFAIGLLILTALPFIILIRAAVFLHIEYTLHPWMALFGGMLASTTVLFLYWFSIQQRFFSKGWHIGSLRQGYFLCLILVLTYCLPSVLYLSASNAKHESVRKEFTALHPILRLSISTLIFLDRDLLITDANRAPTDYHAMGLKVNKHSLHYPQSNGYAHAIDLRTIGHSTIRNGLITFYFKAMGFNTLHHNGTADHLHVSLYSHDRPGGL